MVASVDQIEIIEVGTIGLHGTGVSAAQWAALQAIVASATTGKIAVTGDAGDMLVVQQADGDDVFAVSTTGINVWCLAANLVVTSDHAGSVEQFRIRSNGHLKSSGTSPGIAVGANAGSTGAVSLVGTDTAGRISITPGGTGIAAGVYATITFANGRADTNYAVLLWSADADAAAAGDNVWIDDASQTTTTFTVRSDAALTSGNQYLWKYFVIGYEP